MKANEFGGSLLEVLGEARRLGHRPREAVPPAHWREVLEQAEQNRESLSCLADGTTAESPARVAADGLHPDALAPRHQVHDYPRSASPVIEVLSGHGAMGAQHAEAEALGATHNFAERSIPVVMGELIGQVARWLAPDATPGMAVPAGPELGSLGIAEVYWQKSNYGAVGGLGIQMRLHAGSKEQMYYFAGSSGGALPQRFSFTDNSVAPEQVREFTDYVTPRTLRLWQERPGAGETLARAILCIIADDVNRHSSCRAS